MENNKPKINKVKNRFLPITESVSKGLEPEGKINDFENLTQIGEGSFGKVYLATHKQTKAIYAIKEINKLNKNNQEGKPYFRREIEIMYKIHHPNVVKLFSHFEDDKNCYFIMEYVKRGNLFDQPSWAKYHKFSVEEVAKYMKEIISAVYYLHNMSPPIIHRDIKPENVLIDENGKAKLTDFGWSNYVNSEVRSTYCGTPLYLAPEMITEYGHDEHLDIWCIGVLMFELLTGGAPFRGKDLQSLNNNILKLRINWPKDINLTAKNLISKILRHNPNDRISLVDMLKHPFFTNNVNGLDNCLIKPKMVLYNPFILSKEIPKISQIEDNISDENDKPIINNLKNNEEINENNENFKKLYLNLQNQYNDLISSFNQLNNSNNEIKNKLIEANQKLEFLQNEKKNLIFEMDETSKSKVQLIEENERMKEILNEKNNYKFNQDEPLNKLIPDRDKPQNEKIPETSIEILLHEKNEEIEKLMKKIEILEKEQNKNDYMVNKFVDLHNSIKKMNENLKIPEDIMQENFNDYRNNIEKQIKDVKIYFDEEISNLSRELENRKKQYETVLLEKTNEIENLKKINETIIGTEKEKYDKIIEKYKQALKSKCKDLELLKLKNKKLEMTFNSAMKKKEENLNDNA